MASAPKVAGTAYVKVDGDQLELKSESGIEAPLFDKVRETVMGQSGPAGAKETARMPMVKGTYIVTPNFPLEKLNDSVEMTVTVEFINGRVYTLSGAYVVGEVDYNSDTGEVEIEFNGVKGIWS
ncbi:MAG: phage tail tube protein [Methylophilaceae bacterium]